MLIRDFTAADISDMLAINSGAWPGVSRLDPTTATASLSISSIAWVAEQDTRVAGYLIAYLASSSYDGEEFLWFKQRRTNFVYVDQIAVAPAFRGRGVGRRFYSKLERWCSVHACDSVVCEVNLVPPNPESLAFHTTSGFSEVGRMVVADGRKVALLERALRDREAAY